MSPLFWCPERPSRLPASVAPLQDHLVNCGVRQLSFPVFGRDPIELSTPQLFLDAVQRASQFEKVVGIHALDCLHDFGNS
jgi:hypothetical protein